ncbi:hypothetical protein [Campylobacter vicugnae]|uniref:hypothetical protein n=1 Tax=Campylobacter vicugnae TaxID=1660076 RepID=UPI000A34FB47|nr:hypothetical protein [Campylobacter sp. RM8966]
MQSIDKTQQVDNTIDDPLNLLSSQNVDKDTKAFMDNVSQYVSNIDDIDADDPLNLLSSQDVDKDTKAFMDTIATYSKPEPKSEPKPEPYKYEGVPPTAMPNLIHDEDGMVVNIWDITDYRHIEALYDQGMLTDTQVDRWAANEDLKASGGDFLKIKTQRNFQTLVDAGVYSKDHLNIWAEYKENPMLFTAKSMLVGAVRGIYGAVDNAIEFGSATLYNLTGDAEKLAILEALNKARNKEPHLRTPEEQELIDNTFSFRNLVGLTEAPSTTAGKVTEGIINFITGYAVSRGALKAAPVTSATSTYANVTGAAVMTDMIAMERGEKNLANLLITLEPQLQNTVLDYLAFDGDDTILDKSLKNAIEGLGAGLVVDGLIAGLRIFKNTHLAIGDKAGLMSAIDRLKTKIDEKDPKGAEANAKDTQIAPVEGKEGFSISKSELEEQLATAKDKLAASAIKTKGNRKGAKRGATKDNSKEINQLQETITKLEKDLKEGNFAPIQAARVTSDDIVYEGSAGLKAFEAEFRAINSDAENLEIFDSVINTARKLGVDVVTSKRSTSATLGSYNVDKNTINIYPNNNHITKQGDELKSQTMLHELIHSVSSKVILAVQKGNTANLTQTQIDGVNELKSIFTIVKNDGKKRKDKFYGFKNEHEFLAELSDPAFRTYLKEKNLWEKVVDGVLKILGSFKEGYTQTNAYAKSRQALDKIMNKYEPTMGSREAKARQVNEQAKEQLISARAADDVLFHSKKKIKDMSEAEKQALKSNSITKAIATTGDFEKMVKKFLDKKEWLLDDLKAWDKQSNSAIRPNKHKTTKDKANAYVKDNLGKVVSKLTESELGVATRFIYKEAEATQQLAMRVLAVRRVVYQFSNTLKLEIDDYLAKVAQGKEDIPELLELYAKLGQVYSMRLALRGLSANVGRALNAHKIKVGASEVDIKSLTEYELKNLMGRAGGHDDILNALKSFSKKIEEGNIKDGINEAGVIRFTTFNSVYAGFLGGILSGYPTHLINIGSSVLNIGMHIATQHMAIFGRALSKRDINELSQIQAAYKGLAAGIADAFRYHKGIPEDNMGYFWRSFKDNESYMDINIKVEHSTSKLTPSHYSKVGREYWVNRDWKQHPVAWTAGYLMDFMTLPLRFLQSTDEAMKAIVYKSELYRLGIKYINESPLYANASKEEKLQALEDIVFDPTNVPIQRENIPQRFIDKLDLDRENLNDKEKKLKENIQSIHSLAIGVARSMTFTTPLNKDGVTLTDLSPNPSLKKWGETDSYFLDNARIIAKDVKDNYPKWILGGVGAGLDKVAMSITDIKHLNNPLGVVMKYTIPFVNTPLNLIKGAGRMTPLAILSREFQADIKEGGVRRWTALNKVALGSFMMWQTWELMEEGRLIGSIPKELRGAAGMPPENSIKIGDTWVSYARFDPIGILIGAVANLGQALHYNEAEEEDKRNAFAAVMIALSNTVISKSYMTALSGLVEAMTADAVNEKTLTQTLAKAITASITPYSSMLRELFGETEYVREIRPDDDGVAGLIEAVGNQLQAIIAPTSLEPRLSVLGEPIAQHSKVGGIRYSDFTQDPVYLELINIGYNGKGVSDTFSLNGIILDLKPSQENAIRKIAGEMGIRNALQELIRDPRYQALPIELRKGEIAKVVNRFYSKAKKEYVQNNPDMFAEYKEGREEKINLLTKGSSKPQKHRIPAIDMHIKERKNPVGSNLF